MAACSFSLIRTQAIQKFDFEYFASLDPAQQTRLLKCLKTGWENPDSGLGCYAMSPSDYDEFAPFFDAVRARDHGALFTRLHAAVSNHHWCASTAHSSTCQRRPYLPATTHVG